MPQITWILYSGNSTLLIPCEEALNSVSFTSYCYCEIALSQASGDYSTFAPSDVNLKHQNS